MFKNLVLAGGRVLAMAMSRSSSSHLLVLYLLMAHYSYNGITLKADMSIYYQAVIWKTPRFYVRNWNWWSNYVSKEDLKAETSVGQSAAQSKLQKPTNALFKRHTDNNMDRKFQENQIPDKKCVFKMVVV